MCGILFQMQKQNINAKRFEKALDLQSWRGPDGQAVVLPFSNVAIGHVRLAIVDPHARSDQPFYSSCKRFIITYNGEIYNHLHLRSQFKLNCKTGSDTETIIQGFKEYGIPFLKKLDGMYAFVIFDTHTRDYIICRDRFGIKPMYLFSDRNECIVASECVAINHLRACCRDQQSIQEWQAIRRPVPGRTFFREISEVLPGSIMRNGEIIDSCFNDDPINSRARVSISAIKDCISESVLSHELGDVENVALISGGIDSSLISYYSNCESLYTVGQLHNNEFDAANTTSKILGKKLVSLTVSAAEIEDAWEYLIRLKGEPLSVPNEALIYLICKKMTPEQKVVLTGEGADELFFGYDNIFRWALEKTQLSTKEFYEKYTYQKNLKMTHRLGEYLYSLNENKRPIEFVEDFFIKVHLPCLLRRMDFSSMAASKEARVPFVNKSLFDLMYRTPADDKIGIRTSKIPLRKIIGSVGLDHVLDLKKIGFSTTLPKQKNKFDEYHQFQQKNLEILQW